MAYSNERKGVDVYIREDRMSMMLEIFMRESIQGKTYNVHSLDKDGLVTSEFQENHCATITHPFIKMPLDLWEVIKKELFSDNEKKLEEEIQKLKGEVNAKNQHIENLNLIFEKTLNKIS